MRQGRSSTWLRGAPAKRCLIVGVDGDGGGRSAATEAEGLAAFLALRDVVPSTPQVLTDAQAVGEAPTRAAILHALRRLVKDDRAVSAEDDAAATTAHCVLFAFVGAAATAEEHPDGPGLKASDWEANGLITDADLYEIFRLAELPVVMVLDCAPAVRMLAKHAKYALPSAQALSSNGVMRLSSTRSLTSAGTPTSPAPSPSSSAASSPSPADDAAFERMQLENVLCLSSFSQPLDGGGSADGGGGSGGGEKGMLVSALLQVLRAHGSAPPSHAGLLASLKIHFADSAAVDGVRRVPSLSTGDPMLLSPSRYFNFTFPKHEGGWRRRVAPGSVPRTTRDVMPEAPVAPRPRHSLPSERPPPSPSPAVGAAAAAAAASADVHHAPPARRDSRTEESPASSVSPSTRSNASSRSLEPTRDSGVAEGGGNDGSDDDEGSARGGSGSDDDNDAPYKAPAPTPVTRRVPSPANTTSALPPPARSGKVSTAAADAAAAAVAAADNRSAATLSSPDHSPSASSAGSRHSVGPTSSLNVSQTLRHAPALPADDTASSSSSSSSSSSAVAPAPVSPQGLRSPPPPAANGNGARGLQALETVSQSDGDGLASDDARLPPIEKVRRELRHILDDRRHAEDEDAEEAAAGNAAATATATTAASAAAPAFAGVAEEDALTPVPHRAAPQPQPRHSTGGGGGGSILAELIASEEAGAEELRRRTAAEAEEDEAALRLRARRRSVEPPPRARSQQQSPSPQQEQGGGGGGSRERSRSRSIMQDLEEAAALAVGSPPPQPRSASREPTPTPPYTQTEEHAQMRRGLDFGDDGDDSGGAEDDDFDDDDSGGGVAARHKRRPPPLPQLPPPRDAAAGHGGVSPWSEEPNHHHRHAQPQPVPQGSRVRGRSGSPKPAAHGVMRKPACFKKKPEVPVQRGGGRSGSNVAAAAAEPDYTRSPNPRSYMSGTRNSRAKKHDAGDPHRPGRSSSAGSRGGGGAAPRVPRSASASDQQRHRMTAASASARRSASSSASPPQALLAAAPRHPSRTRVPLDAPRVPLRSTSASAPHGGVRASRPPAAAAATTPRSSSPSLLARDSGRQPRVLQPRTGSASTPVHRAHSSSSLRTDGDDREERIGRRESMSSLASSSHAHAELQPVKGLNSVLCDVVSPLSLLGEDAAVAFREILVWVAENKDNPAVTRPGPAAARLLSQRAAQQTELTVSILRHINSAFAKAPPQATLFKRILLGRFDEAMGLAAEESAQSDASSEGGHEDGGGRRPAAATAIETSIVISGYKDSGKSTALRLLLTEFFACGAKGRRAHRPDLATASMLTDFLFVCNLEACLPKEYEYSGDEETFFCVFLSTIVGRLMGVLLTYRPEFRKWQGAVLLFWKRVLTGCPSLPKKFQEAFPVLALAWQKLATLLHTQYAAKAYSKILTNILVSLPLSCDFRRVYLAFDGAAPFIDSTAPFLGTVFPALLASFSSEPRVTFFATVPEKSMPLLQRKLPGAAHRWAHVPLMGLVDAAMLPRSVPTTIRCEGRVFGIEVFGGCPGYLTSYLNMLGGIGSVGGGLGGDGGESTADGESVGLETPDREEDREIEFFSPAVLQLLTNLEGLQKNASLHQRVASACE